MQKVSKKILLRGNLHIAQPSKMHAPWATIAHVMLSCPFNALPNGYVSPIGTLHMTVLCNLSIPNVAAVHNIFK